MSVISEEDMLAGALLWWLAEEPDSDPVPTSSLPDLVECALDWRWSPMEPPGSDVPTSLAVLVADCERRWEVEQAEREVLEAAERLARETYEARRAFLVPPDATPLLSPVARLAGARHRQGRAMSACPSCGGVVSCARECRAGVNETLGKPVERCPCGNTLPPPRNRGAYRAKFCGRRCPAREEHARAGMQAGGQKSAARYTQPERFGGVR